MKNIMKKTNLTKALYTSIITSIFISTTSVAAIPTMELLEAQPIKQASLKNAAQESLMQSFSAIEIDANFTDIKAETKLTKHKVQAEDNKPVTLAKTTFIAD